MFSDRVVQSSRCSAVDNEIGIESSSVLHTARQVNAIESIACSTLNSALATQELALVHLVLLEALSELDLVTLAVGVT